MPSNPSNGTLAQRMVSPNPGKRLTSLVSRMESFRWLANSVLVPLLPQKESVRGPS